MKLVHIPCSEINIELDNLKTVGYDFSVKDNETFTTIDGVVVKNTAAIYRFHHEKSLNEILNNTFVLDLIKFDHNNDFVHSLTSEAIYIYNLILTKKPISNDEPIIINNIFDLDENFNLFNKYNNAVKFNDNIYLYSECLINKWLSFDSIIITKSVDMKDLYNLIYINSNSNTEYHNKLFELNKRLVYLSTILKDDSLTTPFNEILELSNKYKSNKLINNLPKNPHIGIYVYKTIAEKYFNELTRDYRLFYLTKSKLRKIAFERSLIGIGYITNANNIIKSDPFLTTLLRGLDEDTFYEVSFGARKGLVDKERITPTSGRMQRDAAMSLSPIELVNTDCKSTSYFSIFIKNEKYFDSLVGKYFLDENTDKITLLTPDLKNKLINKTIKFRSPITCYQNNNSICKVCFGEYKSSKYTGISTSMYLTERTTQLSMSSFHTSGSATLILDNELKDFIKYHLVDIVKHKSKPLTKLIFDSTDFPNIITKIPGFELMDNNYVIFKNLKNVKNEDISNSISKIRKLLKVEKGKNITSIEQTYEGFMDEFLLFSNIYSTFIEVLMCNLFVNKNDLIIRYAQRDGLDSNIYRRRSITTIPKESKILALAHMPNKRTIENFQNNIELLENIDKSQLSVYEKFIMGYSLIN